MEKVIKTIASAVGNVTEVLPFQCCIIIDGKKLNCYDTLTLNQRFSEHHHFTITITTDQIENVWLADIPDPQTLISKHTTIQLYKGFALGAESNDFSGIITKAYYTQKASHKTILTLEGYSKTIILDQGTNYCIWQDRSLADIVSDIASHTSAKLAIENHPAFLALHRTLTQCNQTDFEYLRNLAMYFGEWFYYRQDRLIFGKSEREEPLIPLYFGDNLREQHFKHSLQPLTHQSVYSYNMDDNRLDQTNNWPKADGHNEYSINHITKADRWLTGSAATHMTAIQAVYKSEIDRYKQAMQAKAATATYQLEAVTTEHNIYPGVRVKIVDGMLSKLNPKPDGNDSDPSLGEFMVLSVNHKYDNRTQEYSNHITAIPYTQKVFPYYTPKPIEPVTASDQLGYIVDGPNAAGEMLVCPHGTTNPKYYAKLRVAQPDINNEGNGGYYAFPVKGSLVVIRHLYNNPNFPYIDTCMPHGKNTDGVENVQNTIRRISTPAGHEIYFDDAEDTARIRIADTKGNSVEFNSKEGKIYINAQKGIVLQGDKIDIIGKQLKIDCSETMQVKSVDQCTLQAQQALSIAGGTLSLAADNTGIVGREDLKTVSKKVDIVAKEDLKLFGQEVELHGQSDVQLKSPKINNAMKADGHEENFEKLKTDLKFIVEFLVDKNQYKGEFGFDWTEWDDKGELMAVQNTSVNSLEYVYDDKKDEYVPAKGNILTLGLQKLRSGYDYSKLYNYPYIVPYFSLLPNQEAKLKMRIRYLTKGAQPDPKKDYLTFNVNEAYEITINGQTNESIKYTPKADQELIDVTIKCKKAGPKQELTAKDESGGIVGKINAIDNTKMYKLPIKVVCVVKDTPTKETEVKDLLNEFQGAGIEKYLNTQSLNQALIQCTVEKDPKYFVAFKESEWDGKYYNKAGNYFTTYEYEEEKNGIKQKQIETIPSKLLREYEKLFEGTNGAVFRGVVMFITKIDNNPKDIVGVSQTDPADFRAVVVFGLGLKDKVTYAHEIGHVLGLKHIFLTDAEKDEFNRNKDVKKKNEDVLAENLKAKSKNEAAIKENEKYIESNGKLIEDNNKKIEENEKYLNDPHNGAIAKKNIEKLKKRNKEIEATNEKNRENIKICKKNIQDIDRTNESINKQITETNIALARFKADGFRFKQSDTANFMDYGLERIVFTYQQSIRMRSDVVAYYGKEVLQTP